MLDDYNILEDADDYTMESKNIDYNIVLDFSPRWYKW
jgi:hypothetical protein